MKLCSIRRLYCFPQCCCF